MELYQELERITSHKSRNRHSLFQLQYFLIGKEPTIQSKLWKCINELASRKEMLEAMRLEIEEINDNIELLNIKIAEVETEEKSKKQEIRVRKLNRKKQGLDRRLTTIKDRIEALEFESTFIAKCFCVLEGKEPLKPYDDVQSQKLYWNEVLTQDFSVRQLMGLPQDMETIKTILAMNSDAEIKKNVLTTLDQEAERQLALSQAKEDEKFIETTQE